MIVALWLLAIQGAIGAFDTLYYHEWRARLPALGPQSASELKLHAAPDFLYAVLFGTLHGSRGMAVGCYCWPACSLRRSSSR
jgi:hypothetical protein